MARRVVRLNNGTPIDPEYFNINDKGRRLTTRDKYALAYASKACDAKAPFSIGAGSARAPVGGVVGRSALEASNAIRKLLIEHYGPSYRPKYLGLVTSFHPAHLGDELCGIGASILLSLVPFAENSVGREQAFIRIWTGQSGFIDLKDRADVRSFLYPRVDRITYRKRRP